MKAIGAALLVVSLAALPSARGDVAGEVERFQTQLEEVLLDSLGKQLDAQGWEALQQANTAFAAELQSPQARTFWSRATSALQQPQPGDTTSVAQLCGTWSADLQHVFAYEMINAQRATRIADAQVWRALIALPKHGSAVEGALALQRLGANARARKTRLAETGRGRGPREC
jgi:hypothetical protein